MKILPAYDGFLLTFAGPLQSVSRFVIVTQVRHSAAKNMFERLQQKWKVGGWQLFLILCTFTIGGSLTGFVGKKIMNALAIGQDWLWAVIYILLMTIIWPLMVIAVSIPFGQFRFFTGYIKKLGAKMGIGKSTGPGPGAGSHKSAGQ